MKIRNKFFDASLGYFIHPLFVILLGCVVLKEKLSLFQIIDVLSGTCGLLFQLFLAHNLPMLALIMGFSFALYGLTRKFIHYDVITSVTLETFWSLPVSLVLFMYTVQDVPPPLRSHVFCML